MMIQTKKKKMDEKLGNALLLAKIEWIMQSASFSILCTAG